MKYIEQIKLIENAIASGNKLSDLLNSMGLSYDDLSYSDSGSNIPTTNVDEFVNIEKIKPSNDRIPAVSFFSGAGGLDIGFELAGFRNLISIEHTEIFCNTLRHNNPNKLVIGPPYYAGDVSDRETIYNLLLENGIDIPFNGIFHGGPPCQSFSIAANQRFNKAGANFKRTGFEDKEKGRLIFDYIWYIKQFRPLAFLIENVGGIAEFDADNQITEEIQKLREIGYIISDPIVLDAAYYNVPQHRKRWIVLGTRGTTPIQYPKPSKKPLPCGIVFQRPIGEVQNHVTREHKAESVLRYMKLLPGQRDHLGRVDRLDASKPSKTIIAGGVKGGGRSHLHPFFPRTISVRECARIQTFPDSYVFTGTTARQFTQVGNAVPPMLAYRLAVEIKKAILNDASSG